MKDKTNHKAIGALLAAIAALLTLALAPTALAGPPNHARTPAGDITGLNKACGAAVDTEGDVYVSSAGEDKVKVYDPDHDLIAQITNANDPCGLAISSHGELLVSEQGTGNVVLYAPDAYPLSATPTYSSAQPIDSSGEAQGISIDPFDDTLFIAKGDRIEAYTNEVQQVQIEGATGDSFKLRFEGQETTAIPFNATAAEAQVALEALSTIDAGGVSVSLTTTGNPRIYRIVFAGVHAYTDQPQIEAISSLTPPDAKALAATSTSGGVGIDETQQVTLTGATGGSFKLKFEGQETAPIAFDAPARKTEGAASVEAALEALSNVAPGDVSVTHSSNGYAVSFEGALAAKDVPQIETITELLPNEVQKVTVNATAGAYNLVATTAVGQGTTTLGSKNVTGVNTSLGAYHVGDAISGSGMPLGATITAVGAGTLEISANANASTNNAALTATETTGAIEFNAFANTGEGAGSIEAALEALPGLDTGDVSVTGGPGGPGGTNPYLVTFEGAFGGRNVPQMTPKKAGITGDATIATVTEGASITASTGPQGWSGRIGEGDFGEATGIGAYTYNTGFGSATRYLFIADKGTDKAHVYSGPSLTALKQRETIDGPPGEEFEFGAAGSPVAVDQANGHFMVYDDGHEMVDEFEATGEFLDQFTDSAFADAEPTGIAVYPEWNEVQVVSVNATGGTFKLGFAGEETGAIARNANGSVLQKKLEELPGIGEENVFVEGSGQGNFHEYTVRFLADLGNGNVESLTCDPTGLTGGTQSCSVSASRQGSGPGQVYVTAGGGAGAKLLVFAPLVAPTRLFLPQLSRVLGQARAVTVDSYGNVYVADTTTIHIYDNEGNVVTEFESKAGIDTRRTWDLAVDGEGNLYTIDGDNPSQQMTYYAPSSYPPTPATTYARHEPALLAGETIESIGVNPANDHVFVGRGNAAPPAGTKIQEFGSVAEGSPGPVIFAPFFGFFNAAPGIGAYGHNGNVYAADGSGKPIAVFDPVGSERISAINGANCPRGGFGPQETIAVEQSNGHVLEFNSAQNGRAAREYDSAGTCVAEFGTFSSSDAFDLAVDNSCALHEPPLTESTTPTCAEFDPADGNLYVASDGEDDSVQEYDLSAFGPLTYGVTPLAESGVADAIGPAVATLNGRVDPRGFDLESCEFEYLSDDEYEQNLEAEDPAFQGASTIPCAESIGEIGHGSGAVDVHADVSSGIAPQATRYRFRLIASNKFGESQGDAHLFGPPLLVTKSALPVAYDEATLRAGIDPSGLETTYRFRYGLGEDEYTQSTADAVLAPGQSPVAVEAPLVGLAEGTEYHFRIVVENEAQTIEGPDQTLATQRRPAAQSCPNAEYRTGPSTFLPDCRAYELVTPPDTRGLPPASSAPSGSGKGYFNTSYVAPRGSGAGESVAYGIGGLPGFDGTGRGDGFLATRGAGAHPPGGWANSLYTFSFAQTGGAGNDLHGISPDLGYWLADVSVGETPTEDALPVANYLRVPAGSAEPGCSPDPERKFELVGCASLGTDPTAQGRYVSAGGAHVIFASSAHLEDEAAPVGKNALYDREAGEAGAEVLSVEPDDGDPDTPLVPFATDATYLASTSDGAAVAFKVDGALYLHRAGQTIQIAASPNTFAGLAENGTRVFYTDTTGKGAAGLYACDAETGPCAGPGAHAPTEIDDNSIFVNVPPDGSRAFISSKDALTGPGEENGNGEHAEADEPNLYEWDGTSLGFVAVLEPEDFTTPPVIPGQPLSVPQDLGEWTVAILGQGEGRALSPTRSTADGDALVFESYARLTAYDNKGRREIYRYSGGQIHCASCDPSGAPPANDALLQIFQPEGLTTHQTLVANLTDDGQRVFFQSSDELLPEDANATIDVYQWKAQGAGDCTRPAGCLALISSGQGEKPSLLYAMTGDGSDVFFETPEKLVTADIAGSPSLYDARVEGGIPDKPAAAPCQGDACQGQGSTPPAVPAPATTGGGAGNVGETTGRRTCTKGKRRVKGRCVKKKKHHHKHKRSHSRANHDRRAGR